MKKTDNNNGLLDNLTKIVNDCKVSSDKNNVKFEEFNKTLKTLTESNVNSNKKVQLLSDNYVSITKKVKELEEKQ